MRKLLSFFLLVISQQLLAQSVSVEKEGLIEVDGKPAFYLVEKNKKMLVEKDFSLQNLDHEELAYLAMNRETYWDGNQEATKYYFRMVFTKTGSTCDITNINSINFKKQVAKIVAGANLVQNGRINEEAERKFVKLHYGQFRPDDQPIAQAPAPPPPPAAPVRSADILLKGNKIYDNGELVGQYKVVNKDGLETVNIYNTDDVMIASAQHPVKNADEDWMLFLNGKGINLLYNADHPLEKLFKFLVEKGQL